MVLWKLSPSVTDQRHRSSIYYFYAETGKSKKSTQWLRLLPSLSDKSKTKTRKKKKNNNDNDKKQNIENMHSELDQLHVYTPRGTNPLLGETKTLCTVIAMWNNRTHSFIRNTNKSILSTSNRHCRDKKTLNQKLKNQKDCSGRRRRRRSCTGIIKQWIWEINIDKRVNIIIKRMQHKKK